MEFINKFEFNTDILPVPEINQKKKIKKHSKKKEKKKIKKNFTYLDELLDKDFISKYFNEK